jgi:hypothetical protein
MEETFPVYKWRFLVLISFSSFTFVQSWCWLGYGSYSDATVAFFGWADDSWVTYYLMFGKRNKWNPQKCHVSCLLDVVVSNPTFKTNIVVGPVFFVVGTPLFLYLIDKKGLRLTCVVGTIMNLVGVLLKVPCLWLPSGVGWALVLVGQALTCVAGVAAMSVPAKVVSFLLSKLCSFMLFVVSALFCLVCSS